MSVFKTFIVPFDFSATALETLRFAADWCARVDGELVVVHGMSLPVIFTATKAYDEDDVVRGLQVHLETKLNNLLQQRGWDGRVVVRPEAVHEWINEVAEHCERSVVILSRHGWSGHHKGLGGTARRIIQALQVPTWLHAAEPRSTKRYLVAIALDGKGGKLGRIARALADEDNAEVELVTVMDTISDVGYLSEVGWEATERDMEHFTKLAREEVDKVSKEVDAVRPMPARVLAGGLVQSLEKEVEAWNASVVVCGKHTRGVLATLFLGSTSDMLARSLPTHVLIVP